jgi:hypothetical protein
MQGAVTAAVVVTAEAVTAVDFTEAATSAAADFTAGAVTGEDVAITPTEGSVTAITPTIITVAGTGQPSVILTARATGSGFHTIEGKDRNAGPAGDYPLSLLNMLFLPVRPVSGGPGDRAALSQLRIRSSSR